MAISLREQRVYEICVIILVVSLLAVAFFLKHGQSITNMAVAEPTALPPSPFAPAPQVAADDPAEPAGGGDPQRSGALTITEAEQAIWEGERTMAELRQQGFSIQFINDTILEARRVLQKANYTARQMEAAARNDTETVALLQEAIDLMKGTYSGKIVEESYAEVLRLMDIVRARRDPAYLLSDKISIVQAKVTDYAKQQIPTKRGAELLAEAKRSFQDERYEEALRYIDEANAELERSRAESPLLRALEESSKGFLERNWKQLVGLVALLVIGIWASWKPMMRHRLRQRIKSLQVELATIAKLMEQAQRDCFERKTIAKITYDLRMDTYRKRRAEIQVMLPTLEEELRLMAGKSEGVRAPMDLSSGVLKVERPGSMPHPPRREVRPAKREEKP